MSLRTRGITVASCASVRCSATFIRAMTICSIASRTSPAGAPGGEAPGGFPLGGWPTAIATDARTPRTRPRARRLHDLLRIRIPPPSILDTLAPRVEQVVRQSPFVLRRRGARQAGPLDRIRRGDVVQDGLDLDRILSLGGRPSEGVAQPRLRLLDRRRPGRGRHLMTRLLKGEARQDRRCRRDPRGPAQQASTPPGDIDADPQSAPEGRPVHGARIGDIAGGEEIERLAQASSVGGAGGARGEVLLEDTTLVRIDFAGEPRRDPLARPGALRHDDASSSRGPACGASRARRFRTAWKNVALAVPIDMPAVRAISMNFMPS